MIPWQNPNLGLCLLSFALLSSLLSPANSQHAFSTPQALYRHVSHHSTAAVLILLIGAADLTLQNSFMDQKQSLIRRRERLDPSLRVSAGNLLLLVHVDPHADVLPDLLDNAAGLPNRIKFPLLPNPLNPSLLRLNPSPTLPNPNNSPPHPTRTRLRNHQHKHNRRVYYISFWIDENMEDTLANVEGAQGQLLKYMNSISSNRWLMIKIFFILIFFLMVFLFFCGIIVIAETIEKEEK